jgi:hypothetical protein
MGFQNQVHRALQGEAKPEADHTEKGEHQTGYWHQQVAGEEGAAVADQHQKGLHQLEEEELHNLVEEVVRHRADHSSPAFEVPKPLSRQMHQREPEHPLRIDQKGWTFFFDAMQIDVLQRNDSRFFFLTLFSFVHRTKSTDVHSTQSTT